MIEFIFGTLVLWLVFTGIETIKRILMWVFGIKGTKET